MDKNYLWWRDGIIYQIYPRSFADSNGDGIGDLDGITARLDYLQDLGVDALWLSPIYPSPDVDFGYDISNYTDVDPKFGSLEGFDRLTNEAHKRGLRVILDLVLNHTSDQHPWFIESRKSKSNPFRDYYLWGEPKLNGDPPNNWLSVFGGAGWELDPGTGQMYFHMFYKEQPDVNWRNPQVRQYMLDVFKFWLDRGVDGFRLDVFNACLKHPDLLDNPPAALKLRPESLLPFFRMQHIHDIDSPDLVPLLGEIRKILDSYGDTYVVGETFLGGPETAAGYTGSDRLHAAFNFDFLRCSWWARAFFQSIQGWDSLLGSDGWPNYVLNNHDTVRSATRFVRGEDDDRLKVAAAMLLSLRGTPFMYYGEDIGMRNISLTRDQIKDPIGRRFWPISVGRDGCRAPMQWSAAPNAGFAPPHTETWLPLHPDYQTRNVMNQQADPDSLLNWYKRLIALRKAHPALRTGSFVPLTQGTNFVLAYLRPAENEAVLVAFNFSSRRQRLVLGPEQASRSWSLLLSNRRSSMVPVESDVIPLEPYEAIFLRQS
ncbi:MAG TPA: alpha-glucosidase [Anaerolinea sp.]|nr:alpha-glucosidase [Anaerolinea sp.]